MLLHLRINQNSMMKICSKKNNVWGFRQSLLSYRDLLEYLNFASGKRSCNTYQKVVNKGADQTAWMRSLVCTIVVPKVRVLSCQCPFKVALILPLTRVVMS